MLSESPHTHLVGPCYREEGSRQTLGRHPSNIKFQPEKNVCMSNLGHDGEADPGADLVGVVRAGAQVEQAC